MKGCRLFLEHRQQMGRSKRGAVDTMLKTTRTYCDQGSVEE
jgi:hypothetical protein